MKSQKCDSEETKPLFQVKLMFMALLVSVASMTLQTHFEVHLES